MTRSKSQMQQQKYIRYGPEQLPFKEPNATSHLSQAAALWLKDRDSLQGEQASDSNSSRGNCRLGLCKLSWSSLSWKNNLSDIH